MAPRRNQTRIPPVGQGAAPNVPAAPAVPVVPVPVAPAAGATVRRSDRARRQIPSEVGEEFRIDDVSGTDSGEGEPDGPAGGNVQDAASVQASMGINDPSHLSVTTGRTADDVRYFFERLPDKVVCKVCRDTKEAEPDQWKSNIRFEYSTKTSNTSLRPHIERYHLDLFLQLAKEKEWKILLPGLVSQARSEATSAAAERRGQFDEYNFHEHLVNFIVADDQSLNIMECREFRALLLLLRGELTEAMIPHRTKLRELIIQAWRRYFHILKHDLSNAKGRVSCTMDIWSDQNRRSYLAITAHWIANDHETGTLKYRTALIAFHRLRGGHDGKTVGEIVVNLLDRAAITVKIGHFTVDNAPSNDTTMREVQRRLDERDIDFDAADRKVMCFGHVIDLSSGRVIDAFTKTRQLADENEDWSAPPAPNVPSRQTYEEAVARDPVAIGRTVVRVIRASGLRRDAFDDVITNGNAKGWFKRGNDIITVKQVQLLRDVRTRWDSVYHMLNRLRVSQPAVNYFLALPNHSDLAQYRITPREWQVMQDVELILSVPHTVQQMMSAESTPILSGTIPAFEMFMTKWEKLSDEHPHLRPFIRKGLDWTYMYYARMDRTRAYVIAMLLNPSIRMTWIHRHWDRQYIDKAETTIRETMAEYRAIAGAEPPVLPSAVPGTGEMPAYMTLGAQYGIADEMDIAANSCEQTIEQEYQAYITAVTSPKTTNILGFWEANQAAFPTLFSMAMDYLPIQASAVPCERIFSSSSETDTKKRNRISPLLMEALQMLKFHLKKDRLNFMAAWMTAEKQMTEDDPDKDLLSELFGDNFQDGLDSVIRSINNDED